MDVSVSGTVDQKAYLKKFRGGFSPLSPPPGSAYVAVTLPAASASCERSFSKMKLVKSIPRRPVKDWVTLIYFQLTDTS